MPGYIAVEWVHDDPREPVTLYSELDDARWETRKVEVWADGSVGWADGAHEVNARLGEVPVPPLADIDAMEEFRPRQITAAEFELVWRDRVGHDGGP